LRDGHTRHLCNEVSSSKEAEQEILAVVALLALSAVTAHVAKAAARVALLRGSAIGIAIVAGIVVTRHHAAGALWAVASDVAETTTLVAFLTSSGLLGWAVLGEVAWLVAAVADTVSFATRSRIARFGAFA